MAVFYSDADPESVSVDGIVAQSYAIGSGVDWATIIAAAGNGKNDSSSFMQIQILSDNTSGNWRSLGRGILLFDTSGLGAGFSIGAGDAILYVYGSKADSLSAAPDINVYSSSPASNTALANGDYTSLGATPFCDTAITYANWSTTAYNAFILNATGIAAIDKTGITKLGLRNANYDVAGVSPTWSSSKGCTFNVNTADNSLFKPKFVIRTAHSRAYIID